MAGSTTTHRDRLASLRAGIPVQAPVQASILERGPAIPVQPIIEMTAPRPAPEPLLTPESHPTELGRTPDPDAVPERATPPASPLESRAQPAQPPRSQSVPAGHVRARVKPAPLAGDTPTRLTLYLYPKDIARMRSLSGYVQSQHGKNCNESLAVRAALSLAEPGQSFVEALDQLKSSDRRRTVPKQKHPA